TEPDGTAHARTLEALRAVHPGALRAQLAPVPPVGLGEIAAVAGASAMLDVSDGLSLDAARISRASAVTIDIDPDALRREFGLQHGEEVSIDAMLFGGE